MAVTNDNTHGGVLGTPPKTPAVHPIDVIYAEPSAEPYSSTNDGATTPDKPPLEKGEATQMEVPGTVQEASAAIESVSPEGQPADPKRGPGAYMWLIALGGLVVLGLSFLIGQSFGWGAAAVGAAIGCVALLFNPVMWAAFDRKNDRQQAVHQVNANHGVGQAEARRR